MNRKNDHIALDQKLAALQEGDSHRKWYSLDDRRVCVLCDKPITGRMIDVRKDRRGSYQLGCPTPGCPGAPRDWFYHSSTQAPLRTVTHSTAPATRFGMTG